MMILGVITDQLATGPDALERELLLPINQADNPPAAACRLFQTLGSRCL